MSRGAGLGATGIRLAYPSPGGRSQDVLDIERLDIEPGASVALTGPSGAGKTSLLYVLTGIERPQSGRVAWDGTDLASLSERGRDRWRRQNVGFIFQDFHLFEGMSPLQNILVPASFDAMSPPASLRQRALALLERVGVPPERRGIETLSRGERQRVAIARALVMAPRLLVADEPTASLDAAAGAMVIDLLLEIRRDHPCTFLTVTHDMALAARCDRRLRLEAGRITQSVAA